MAKIYRAMKDDAAKPAIGPRDLGVRIPPDDVPDIVPDAVGAVHPLQGGMSVAPSLLVLPDARIPKRLRHLIPSARGSNNLFVWSMGDGDFVASSCTEYLAFRPDPDNPAEHGFVEPINKMPFSDYDAALFSTRDEWHIDESS